MNATAAITGNQLERRRRDLGMSLMAIAHRSGVSLPTVRRILRGRLAEASFVNVAKVSEALGAPIGLAETDINEFRRRQARSKAERIARLVQGTSALESQAVDASTYDSIVERSFHELLAGPKRRLWSD